jgi:hypothetical protein
LEACVCAWRLDFALELIVKKFVVLHASFTLRMTCAWNLDFVVELMLEAFVFGGLLLCLEA